MAVQRRESDLVLGTFGRGFYVLDDFSPLRDMSAEALAADAHLFPLRDPYLFNTTGLSPAGSAGIGNLSGNFTTPNPPRGAVFTYHVGVDLLPEETLVLVIRNNDGDQVRELELDGEIGLQRVTWNLRADPPEPEADEAGSESRGGGGFQARGGRSRQGPMVEGGRYVASLGVKASDTVVEVGPTRSFHVIPIQW
jgi:hypothetical protein